MVEKGATGEEFLSEEAVRNVITNVSLFAEQLAQWDKRIVEIVGIGNIAKGTLSADDVILLVCTFNPSPEYDSEAFFSIANLLVRADDEQVYEKLSITHGIDLGFRMGNKIFLPNGITLLPPKDQITVWPQYDE